MVGVNGTWQYFLNMVHYDWYQKWFVEPATGFQEGIIQFHDELMVVLTFVIIFVGTSILLLVKDYKNNYMVSRSIGVHGVLIETVWTVVPGVVLGFVTVPSFALLYSLEDIALPSITVKVIGKQWYWTYEYLDVDEENVFAFDSYMLMEEELNHGELRLLEVDNRLQLPGEVYVRILVTASDVLHSFAVPSFGIKLDAIPGRLNEVILFIERPGTYYGQCSELCGVNHAFMPIGIDVMSLADYIDWYYTATTDYWVANWSNWEYPTSIR